MITRNKVMFKIMHNIIINYYLTMFHNNHVNVEIVILLNHAIMRPTLFNHNHLYIFHFA